jgi:hypothetical protein
MWLRFVAGPGWRVNEPFHPVNEPFHPVNVVEPLLVGVRVDLQQLLDKVVLVAAVAVHRCLAPASVVASLAAVVAQIE